MKAYSLDLRERVMAAYEQDQRSIAQVAEQFDVGPTFVKKMLRQKRERGTVAALAHGGGRQPSLTDKEHRLLRHRIKQQPDASLTELQEHLTTTAGVSQTAMNRWQRDCDSGLTRKKRA